MKSFFGKMSFPRAVILICSLGSLVMGALVYRHATRLREVKVELTRVKELVKAIQTDAYRLDSLQHRADTEKFKAQEEPETYIRSVAAQDHVEMGQLDFTKRVDEPLRGVTDTIYTIKPQSRTFNYNRTQVGNFLYRLESESPRVKVTRIKLTPFDKAVPGEVGKDRWNFEADLCTRTKDETVPSTRG